MGCSRGGSGGAGLGLALAAALLGARAGAADIRGAVHVPKVVRKTERSTQGAYGARIAARPEDEAELPVRTEAQNVVVFIKEAVPGRYAPPAEQPEMAQLGASFVPKVLPVLAGTGVSFPNMDPIFHNIFSLSKTASFNLGRYPRGNTKIHVFGQPGMVRVNCDIHADMLGYILVLPHPYFATPDADGTYAIRGVPAGKYNLVAWHDTLPPQVRQIVVPAEGTLQADYQF